MKFQKFQFTYEWNYPLLDLIEKEALKAED